VAAVAVLHSVFYSAGRVLACLCVVIRR
jgi:hypothetical protein